MSLIKTANEVDSMRIGGQILASVLQHLANSVESGMTTKHLSNLALSEITRLGGKPAFLGFEGYPDIICISVNEEVQHTIPGNRIIASGDIVNFDFGVLYEGMVTDAGITVGVDVISPAARRLIEATRDALGRGIDQVRAGARVGDISAVIESRLKRDRLGIIEELVGHGVGHELHEEPMIPNYGKPGRGPTLVAGMTIAIEPMANLGSRHLVMHDDGWTITTADGSWSSQHEHTVLVTDTGYEILTLPA